MGFGPYVATSWRVLGPVWPLFVGLMAILALLTILKLVHDWRTLPAERLRTFGLLCFGGAMLCLVGALGWGRGAVMLNGFATRFQTLAAPALVLVFLVSRTSPRPVVAWGLSALLVALFLYDTNWGLERAVPRAKLYRDLHADIAQGMTPAEMATKWTGPICNPDPRAVGFVTECFEMMRQTRQGPYKQRSDD
jgi:hypothetical protein